MAEYQANVGADPLTTLDVFDDFISGIGTSGQLGSLGFVFGGGTAAAIIAPAGHPGTVRRDTSATISTFAYTRLLLGTGVHPLIASELFDCIWVFRLNVNDANTRVRLGLSSDATVDAPVSAIYLEKQGVDTSWFGTCRDASTESRTAAIAAVDTGWHKIRIRRIDAATVGFTIDALAEVTLATNAPGAVGVHPMTQLFNIDAVSKTLDHDFFRLRITGLAR